jgi:hypothetical protein
LASENSSEKFKMATRLIRCERGFMDAEEGALVNPEDLTWLATYPLNGERAEVVTERREGYCCYMEIRHNGVDAVEVYELKGKRLRIRR